VKRQDRLLDPRVGAAEGIVSRREFREGAALATEYAFTDYGLTLKPILTALADWGANHQRLAR